MGSGTQRVLITGATAGIGTIGIQIAKALGPSPVIATTRTAAKSDLLTCLGAAAVIVTGEEDLTEAALAATDRKGTDVVLDHVAGDSFAQCLPATAVDGHVVNIGRLAGPASTIDLEALSYRHLSVHGVSFGFSRDWETQPRSEPIAVDADGVAGLTRDASAAFKPGGPGSPDRPGTARRSPSPSR